MTGHSSPPGRPRPAITDLPSYKPGRSAEAAEIDHGVTDAIKLASNELPFGPLPSVVGAISGGLEHAHLYPDHRATALREALGTHLGVDVDQVTVGAGSVGLLQQICLTYCGAGDEVAMCWPSFEAYPVSAMLVEAEQIRVPLRDETFDLPALAEAVTGRTKVVFIANPNNPTGTAVGTDEIVAFLEALPSSCLVVLDEAYREFVDDARVTDSIPLLADHPNLLITRTFSKAHGLAGLRVGYAIGHPDVVALIDRTLVPFVVNDLGQRAAVASIAAVDEMEARVATVVDERRRLRAALRDRGWTVPDAQANFVWLPLGELASEFAIELERRGVVTRAFADVGVRITVGDRGANERLVAAIDATGLTPR